MAGRFKAYPAPSIARESILTGVSLRILVLLLLVIPLSAVAGTLVGKVVGVTDGDTITVLVAEKPVKVRLAEIDTPERGQPWAARAKQALSDKVFGEDVEVRVVTVDRYGRTVGHVWIGDRHINRELIREGQHVETFWDELTDVQLEVLDLLGTPASDYGH